MSIIVWLYKINTYISCYETIFNNVSDIVIVSNIEYTQLHKVLGYIQSDNLVFG